jgi:hypothetical protein
MCGLCNYTTIHSGFNVKKHMFTHFGHQVRPFKCPYCDKGFVQRTFMKAHIVTRHAPEMGASADGASFFGFDAE